MKCGGEITYHLHTFSRVFLCRGDRRAVLRAVGCGVLLVIPVVGDTTELILWTSVKVFGDTRVPTSTADSIGGVATDGGSR